MFQESLSSIVWFQPVWGLCAYVQHLVTTLHLGGWGVLSPSRTTQKYMSGFLEEELGLCFIAELVDCFSFDSALPHFPN